MKVLYVTDRSAVGDARFFEILEELSDAPVSVELRERGTEDQEVLRVALAARQRLGAAVPLSVNRRFDIALAAGADGVHLPADGLPLARVRAHTPRGFRIGVSTHSTAEARAAMEAGADAVVIGPIFDTPSKRAFGAPLGPETLSDLPPRDSHSSDVFAIGGISEDNLGALDPYLDRISGIAAIRLFQEAASPRAMAERLTGR
ncbi:MAG: thiamine phosphate synthase [Thermoanaerobaculia bacterium]